MIEHGQPERSVITTCAYCGVGCSFKAEMQGNEVVRMMPYKDGKANDGHSCVKGRFAWGYATHKDRITKPMIRDKITDPWREVTWEEAIAYAASEFKRIQAKYGRGSIGGITSSRCTNEEVYLVQKLVRAAFGNNNVDTCARVCHSPTGYGLKTTFGTSAGTQDFDSVEDSRRDHGHRRQPDRRPSGVRLAHEAAPARGREADRRRPAPHRPGAHAARRGRPPPAAAARHQRRGDQRAGARRRHRGPDRRGLRRASAATLAEFALGELRRAARELARGDRRPSPACRRPSCARPPGSTPPAATPRSTTASASPSTARARPW